MPLLADLIDIPESVQRDDFVVKLTAGVADGSAAKTLGSYVVTPELATKFDEALAFVKAALETGTSKATFLHGSFGSGKSHFMAVLHRIVQGDPAARGLRGWPAREAMARIREEFAWLAADGTTLHRGGTNSAEPVWWTFAGTKANAALKATLQPLVAGPIDAGSCSLRFDEGLPLADAELAVATVRAMSPAEILPEVDPAAVEGLKFSQCLPQDMTADLVRRRMADPAAVAAVVTDVLSTVTG